MPEETFPRVFGRISFFVNAGIRFVEEHAKLRAMGQLWEEIGRERYGVDDERFLRFRYGVQVNSLGLTESQPENNIIRIVLEALAVTMGRDARARALQLPAWNEALGLPRPWDQQWSLRIQQILAYETDLLDYPDIFEGSQVMDGLVDGAGRGRARGDGGRGRARRRRRGRALHEDAARRVAPRARAPDRGGRAEGGRPERLHRGRAVAAAGGRGRRHPDAWTRRSSASAIDARRARGARRATRPRWTPPWTQLARGRRRPSENIMPATLAAAAAGATTGEWAGALRDGLRRVPGAHRRRRRRGRAAPTTRWPTLRERVERVSEALGRRIKILVGKPGLDGHSNGAEQIAVRARDAGMDVVYEGIRLTPARIARTAVDEGVHVVGPVDPVRLPRAS